MENDRLKELLALEFSELTEDTWKELKDLINAELDVLDVPDIEGEDENAGEEKGADEDEGAGGEEKEEV